MVKGRALTKEVMVQPSELIALMKEVMEHRYVDNDKALLSLFVHSCPIFAPQFLPLCPSNSLKYFGMSFAAFLDLYESFTGRKRQLMGRDGQRMKLRDTASPLTKKNSLQENYDYGRFDPAHSRIQKDVVSTRPDYVSAYSCPHRRESPAAGGGTQIDAQQ
jgi:hypothetical protein